MKVWVSKYALTKGIFEAEVEPYGDYVYQRLGHYSAQYKLSQDCHETWEFALFKAEEMRNAKIASLKKQIAKLERLDISRVKTKQGAAA